MSIQFPAPASQGDTFTASNGVIYTYDNGGWTANSVSGLDNNYVNVTGDNMTGDLTLGTDNITLDADNGSATFADSVTAGTNPIQPDPSVSGATLYPGGQLYLSRPTADDVALYIYKTGETGAKVSLWNNGSATFAGEILSGVRDSQGVFMNQNAAVEGWAGCVKQWSFTTVGGYVKGNITSDGTIGFNLGNGTTLDVKDRLQKTDAALQALKTAASSAVDFAELKSAIATALADI